MTCQPVAIAPAATTITTTTSTTSSRNRSSSPVHRMHRDQHQIRHRLLQRLGIDKPSITMGTVRTIPKLSTKLNSTTSNTCHNEKSQTSSDGSCYHVALQQSQDDDRMDCACSFDQHPRKKIRFASTVQVQEIPSHADYDEEDRQAMWMSTKEIEVNARRNRIEYLADGCDYTKATEENRMMRWRNEDANGKVKWEWIHPATYWLRYQQEQDRILLEEHQELLTYKHKKSRTNNNGGCGGGSCKTGMETAPATAALPIKKSPTVTSLTGMAA